MAKTVDELLVYLKARDGAVAISALLKTPKLAADRVLSSQLNKGSIRVVSDIAEGFEQKTDRGFAKYLYDARGSAREIRSQLDIAAIRGRIDPAEGARIQGIYDEVAKMLSGLITYLESENRTHRQPGGR